MMQLSNTTTSYGWASISLHWLMALLVIGLYLVGDYMVELTYYNPLYHTLPNWHKQLGILTGLLLLIRLAWLYSQPRPQPVVSPAPAITHTLAKVGHWSLYGLLVVMLISGYLISTAKGKGIELFGLFELPALLPENVERGELAGKVHQFAGLGLMLLVSVHALAALFHHFHWKDHTLTRMLGLSGKH